MKLIKMVMLFMLGVLFTVSHAFAQQGNADPFINIVAQNSGLINQGGQMYLQVTVGNNGPNPITAYRVRSTITVSTAFLTLRPHAEQTPLPAGWIISSPFTTGGSITICNGTDIIPVGVSRTFLLRVQGNTVGTPPNINGQLSFSGGANPLNCTGPTGAIGGDNSANNNSQAGTSVVPANQCTLAPANVSLTGPASIACFGGTTTLTANSGQPTNIEYSLNGGAFQTGNTFTLPVGTYTAEVRRISDPACTVTTNTVTITQPASALSATASATNTTTVGGNDGTATANPAGGTAGYTYSWSPGGQTTQTATALTAGTYNVTVTDLNGCTAGASATVNDPIVTPLTLIDFKAKLVNCQPVLNWITENEINTDRFEIEKSNLSSPGWLTVGVVAANGYTTTKSIYNFIDRNANGSSGQVLYRLKMIDQDGRYKYSKELRVASNCKTTRLEVYLNPASNSINVNHSIAKAGAVMQLFDMKGTFLFSKTIPLDAFLTTIDISRLPAAAYVLVFINGNDKKSVLFEKLSH